MSIEFGSLQEQIQSSEQALDFQARKDEVAGPPYDPKKLKAQRTITAVEAQAAMQELETENLMIEDPVEYENQQIEILGGLDGTGSEERSSE